MSNTLVFIDEQVENYGDLVKLIGNQADLVIIDKSKDGIEQMVEALKYRNNLDSIQIISHGHSGALFLGTTVLDNSNLINYTNALKKIGASLSTSGDLLLYGCNVAAGETGLQFINNLAQYTGADISASNDLTGYQRLGGNWILEANTGAIEAPQLFNINTANTYTHLLVDDYSSDTLTTGEILIGGSITGNLETMGDQDWFKVTRLPTNLQLFDNMKLFLKMAMSWVQQELGACA